MHDKVWSIRVWHGMPTTVLSVSGEGEGRRLERRASTQDRRLQSRREPRVALSARSFEAPPKRAHKARISPDSYEAKAASTDAGLAGLRQAQYALVASHMQKGCLAVRRASSQAERGLSLLTKFLGEG